MATSNHVSHPQYTERRIGVQTLPQNITAAIIQLASNVENHDDQSISLLSSPRWLLKPPILVIKRLHELTLVCPAWRSVVLRTPAMWNRIVIFLDHDLASSMAWVLLCLQRSHCLPLSVYMYTRVDPGHAADVEQESKTVATLLSAIARNFDRVVALSIEAYHSTSLPDVVALLKRHALPRLKTLVLHGTSNERLDLHPACTQQRGTTQISGEIRSTLPSLQHLVIDAPNLLKILSTIPDSIHILLGHLSTLIISDLTPNTPNYTEERLTSLFTLLPSLIKLHTLAFERFQIDQSLTLQIPRPLLGTSIAWLGMKGMESHAVRYVFECITDPDEVVLVGCGFGAVPVRVPSSARYLTMFGMPGCWIEYKERAL